MPRFLAMASRSSDMRHLYIEHGLIRAQNQSILTLYVSNVILFRDSYVLHVTAVCNMKVTISSIFNGHACAMPPVNGGRHPPSMGTRT